jgi:hypothetical protein
MIVSPGIRNISGLSVWGPFPARYISLVLYTACVACVLKRGRAKTLQERLSLV